MMVYRNGDITTHVCMNFDFGLFIDSPFVTKLKHFYLYRYYLGNNKEAKQHVNEVTAARTLSFKVMRSIRDGNFIQYTYIRYLWE